jgi:hypothetical protein
MLFNQHFLQKIEIYKRRQVPQAKYISAGARTIEPFLARFFGKIYVPVPAPSSLFLARFFWQKKRFWFANNMLTSINKN